MLAHLFKSTYAIFIGIVYIVCCHWFPPEKSAIQASNLIALDLPGQGADVPKHWELMSPSGNSVLELK